MQLLRFAIYHFANSFKKPATAHKPIDFPGLVAKTKKLKPFPALGLHMRKAKLNKV